MKIVNLTTEGLQPIMLLETGLGGTLIFSDLTPLSVLASVEGRKFGEHFTLENPKGKRLASATIVRGHSGPDGTVLELVY